jgi:hypothetical protein
LQRISLFAIREILTHFHTFECVDIQKLRRFFRGAFSFVTAWAAHPVWCRLSGGNMSNLLKPRKPGQARVNIAQLSLCDD